MYVLLFSVAPLAIDVLPVAISAAPCVVVPMRTLKIPKVYAPPIVSDAFVFVVLAVAIVTVPAVGRFPERFSVPVSVTLSNVFAATPANVTAPPIVIVPVAVLTVVTVVPRVFPVIDNVPVLNRFVAPVVILILAAPSKAVVAFDKLVAPVIRSWHDVHGVALVVIT